MKFSLPPKKIINNNLLFYVLTFLFVFVSIYIFYTIYHPVYLYDTDDWFNVCVPRFPFFSKWNTTKILPEFLCTLVSFFAPLFNIFVKDIVKSVSYSIAFIFSIFVSLYFVSFAILLKKHFDISKSLQLIFLFIILFMHFIIYANTKYVYNDNNYNIVNYYMFYANRFADLFHYSLIGIICGIVVNFYLSFDINNFFNNLFYSKENSEFDKYLKIGIVYFLIMLLMSSNLFFSIMITSVVSLKILYDFYIYFKEKKFKYKNINIILFIKKQILNLSIILYWIVVQIAESRSGRARSVMIRSGSFFENFCNQLKIFFCSFNNISIWFVLTYIVIIIPIFLFIFNRKNKKYDIKYFWLAILSIFSFFIVALYNILLSTAASGQGGAYVSRLDVKFSILYFAILFFAISLTYMIKNFKFTMFLLPFILWFLLMRTMFGNYFYADIPSFSTKTTLYNFDKYVIDQYTYAEENNIKEFDLHLVTPTNPSSSAWPFPSYAGRDINATLIRLGVVSRMFKVNVIYDENINKKYLK